MMCGASSCQTCGAKSDRDTGVNVIDLSYPRKVSELAWEQGSRAMVSRVIELDKMDGKEVDG
jgi:hypothetical protein